MLQHAAERFIRRCWSVRCRPKRPRRHWLHRLHAEAKTEGEKDVVVR